MTLFNAGSGVAQMSHGAEHFNGTMASGIACRDAADFKVQGLN